MLHNELHYTLRRWQSHLDAARFIRPAAPNKTHALTEQAVSDLTARLIEAGYAVEATSHKAKYDLVVCDVDGRWIAIEVKASSYRRRSDCSTGRYQAVLKRGQKAAADVVALGCLFDDSWKWFLIPAGAVTGKSINITQQDPADYAGKYSLFFGAWSVIRSAFRTAPDRSRQLSMEESTL